jgi:hypothetical protein
VVKGYEDTEGVGHSMRMPRRTGPRAHVTVSDRHHDAFTVGAPCRILRPLREHKTLSYFMLLQLRIRVAHVQLDHGPRPKMAIMTQGHVGR